MDRTLSHSLLALLKHASVALAALSLDFGAHAGEPLFRNSGFESGTLNGWTQVGDAFQFQPTKGDNPRARGRESSAHEGDYWIGGFERYDGRNGRPGDVFGDDS